MSGSWSDYDDWSRKRRAADSAPDSRLDPRVAGRLAELAARHAPPRARHIGRASYQDLAIRLAEVETERDAWRARAAAAERELDDRSSSRLTAWCGGSLSALICLAGWWGIVQLVAAIARRIVGGG